MTAAVQAASVEEPRRSFIRATEIWTPDETGQHLVLGSGLYGPLSDFEAVSKETRFAHDEGLPGKAWAAGHPIILKDLVNSYFKRGEAAKAAGLTCGLAVPIFDGAALKAVLVLFCGDDREHVGAIEVWNAPDDGVELGLVDGYYGTADALEWSSRRIKFPRGAGLPGMVWESGMPVIMEDLGQGRRFLRWESAERVGINRGVGIPCFGPAKGAFVLSLLSALGTPIARRVECWAPDADGKTLSLKNGYCEIATDLASSFADVALPIQAGTLGKVYQGGAPAICVDLAGEPSPIGSAALAAGLEVMVALPVYSEGRTKAIVAWYL